MERMLFPVTRREAGRLGIQFSSEANKNSCFPSRLRELRKEKGVSQDALSKELGVTKSTIGLWETGDTLPDAKAIFDLANYFGVSADWILGRSDIQSVDNDVRKIHDMLPLSEKAINSLLRMSCPDNLGGDPEIVYALNILLEGMSLMNPDGCIDVCGFALLCISDYFKFHPTTDFIWPEHILDVANVPENTLTKLTNQALEAQLLNEISESLKHLKEIYYPETLESDDLPF